MEKARKVTVIQPTINPLTHLSVQAASKRKVAGYARVSTAKDEQFTSYEAQVDYYTQLIQSRPDWEFVKVYTDEGITGTSTKHRDGFKEMIEAALAGKIDLIVTKSVSRFARNTVDSLVTIRKLKEVGCECFFEKENIYTFDGKGELLLTIMSSLAQEESRSISENVTWGQRKRFADGKVSLPYKHFLGYEKGDGKDAPPVINREQAETVRKIYKLFMSGKTACGIAKQLTEEGIPTPAGKQKWCKTTVESILRNEKYKGAALLQKRFTVDYLTKTSKVNEGEVPQYYVSNSHDAIIAPEEWEAVQEELKRRKAIGRAYSGKSVLSAKIVCADCGEWFGLKEWHSTDKYKRTIWQCNGKYRGEGKCSTPHFYDDDIKNRFLKVYNGLLADRESIIEDLITIKSVIAPLTDIDGEMSALLGEIEVITELTRKCIDSNRTAAQDQSEYAERYNGYVERYEKARQRYEALEKKKAEAEEKIKAIDRFIYSLSVSGNIITEFDDTLWLMTVDRVIAEADGTLIFVFKDGRQISG